MLPLAAVPWRVSRSGCHWVDFGAYTLFAASTYWALKRNGFFVVEGNVERSLAQAKGLAYRAYRHERAHDFDQAA